MSMFHKREDWEGFPVAPLGKSQRQPKAEADHIGFDPVLWVDRLQLVNDCSEFTAEEKFVIAAGLRRLRDQLEGLKVPNGGS